MNKIKLMRQRKRLKSLNRGKARLTVFRSNRHIYAQIVDDLTGKTLAAANTKSIKTLPKGKLAQATKVGELLGEAAMKKKLLTVYFDRATYKFHGRVKALADAARAAGLKF